MNPDFLRYEGLVHGGDHPRWNQSFYYQAYDARTRVGFFIRIGLLANANEANTWLIAFRDGRALYTRTNQNLPYTAKRPVDGIELAGLRVHAEVPLKKTRITFASPDFSLDLVWIEASPLEDCIAMTQDADGSFAREIAHVHLEGTSRVTGHIVTRGERVAIDGSGFRDLAAGVRNWDGLQHYRLAWPVFDNGLAFAGIHGISTGGQSAYMRMMFDGKRWQRVKHVEDRMTFDDEGFAMKTADWTFVDENDRRWELTARPLFRWLFPLDSFVLCEQLAEFRLADDSVGYGLYETGYRLPWNGA